MWHYCEYVPGILVEGGQLYHCYHCHDEQFVPDPSAPPDPVEQPKWAHPQPLDEIPF